MGFRIFLHAIHLVFDQFTPALRISGLLYFLSSLLSFLSIYFFPVSVSAGVQSVPSWPYWLISAAAVPLYGWIAVAWHRFILLDEGPAALFPRMSGTRILSYLGRSIQIFFIVSIIMLIGSISFGVIAILSGAEFFMIIAILLISSIVLLVFYRLAPLLPGAAIGQPIGVKEAWKSTSGATGDIFVLALISALASFLIDVPLQFFPSMPFATWLAFAWSSGTAWIKLMVGVSILTAIYGVYVEKRTIA